MGELQPCPFCGGTNLEEGQSSESGLPWWHVACLDCSASVEAAIKGVHIDRWNTRSPVCEDVWEELVETIYRVLRDHKLTNMLWEDGESGYPLVDAVSNEPPATIESGEEQLQEIAAEIAYTLAKASLPGGGG